MAFAPGLALMAAAQQPAPSASAQASSVHWATAAGSIDIQVVEPNVVRVDVRPHGKSSTATPVLDPAFKAAPGDQVSINNGTASASLTSPQLTVSLTRSGNGDIVIRDASGKLLVEEKNALADAASHGLNLTHTAFEDLYGMRGLGLRDNGSSILRNSGATVTAASQGDGGAPFFFTTRYGVLIDSNGGVFDTQDGLVSFGGDSRADLEYFVIAGPPKTVFAGLADLTGHIPMPPKWSMGFLNSQWGSNQAELLKIAAEYRQKQIPLDAFILDFDWKAWGEDNYGEWRWNSTSGPGNVAPDKFPDGASGKFAAELRQEGIRICGILKPRILLYKYGSHSQLDMAASYAQAHRLWYPGEPPTVDYFSHRLSRDLNFNLPATRAWYWQHLQPSFKAGVVGWWNDEADVTGLSNGTTLHFDNFQFFNMGRMLYDGQRSVSQLRVWSINRNYYLGAQRYGYGEWSGDIQTGFNSMEHQRARMISTLDLGEPQWSMDTGGFFGDPSPENYARWMEFAAFVPIYRVHGMYEQLRQPWVFGPVAEAAAVRAIRLRYELMPYIYSYERVAHQTGVGLVRPLFWEYPNDPRVANDSSAWMFGDSLLVSPVVTQGTTEKNIYLPAGVWYDYFRGTRIDGGRTINYPVDPHTWQDIPLFVREGSILATQPVQEYANQNPVPQVTLDVFPGAETATFSYYDDNGETYAYEHGAFYNQNISATKDASGTHIHFAAPSGSYTTPLRTWLVRLHTAHAVSVRVEGGQPLQWKNGQDRFGPVVTFEVPARQALTVDVTQNHP